MTTTKSKYRILSLYALTESISQLYLEPVAQPLQHQAGQYIPVYTHNNIQAPYSIANAPIGSGLLELHIRHQPKTEFSRTLMADLNQYGQLNLGDVIGDMTLDKLDTNKEIILLAGGTGFAPIKAIIEQLHKQGCQQTIYLYWGAQTETDLYLQDMAARWAKQHQHFHFIPVLSNNENSRWQGREGLVHQAVVDDFESLANFQVFAAGPFEMVFAAKDDFMKKGLSADAIYSDAFSVTNSK